VDPLFVFLLVEDDRTLSRTLSRHLAEFGTVVAAASIAEARGALAKVPNPTGIIVDVGLPDGSGLEWLREVRAGGCRAPALVLTAQRSEDLIAEVQLTDAYYLPKPPREANLRAFVERSRQERTRAHARLREEVGAWSRRHALSPREEETLLIAASGVPRCDLAGMLGVEETTTKTIVRNLLRKAHKSALADAVSEIHRTVFGETRT
jgi:DNA-binding NarL/FixJ family response regulator